MNADRERRTAWWQQLWWSIPPIRWSLWYTENKTPMWTQNYLWTKIYFLAGKGLQLQRHWLSVLNRLKSILHRTIESVTNRKQLNWTGLKSDAKCCKSKLFCYSKYGQLPEVVQADYNQNCLLFKLNFPCFEHFIRFSNFQLQKNLLN